MPPAESSQPHVPLSQSRGSPSAPEPYPFERFAARRAYYDFDFLPGTTDVLYAGNTSGQFNVWRQSPPQHGRPGPSMQLTSFDEWSARSLFPQPNGKEVLVFADKDGDENYQIFAVDPRGGWPAPVVYEPKVRHEPGIGGYSPHGRLLAFASNARNPRDMDIVVLDRGTSRMRPVCAGDGARDFGMWSPDSSRLTVIENLTANTDNNVLLVDVRRETSTNLTPHTDKTRYIPGPWSPDGSGFYVLSDQGREFLGLGFLRRDGGDIRWIATPDHDVEDVALSPDGRRLAWVVNDDGYSAIHIHDRKSGKPLRRPIRPGGVLAVGWASPHRIHFSPDGTRLGFILWSGTRPHDVCVVRLPGAEVVRHTDGFLGAIPERSMVRPSLVTYPSVDRRIPAWLYRPKVRRGTKSPAIVVIHGGPESQERPEYRYCGLYQYLVAHGVGILAPNIRGSTGYGASYQRLIHRDWGGEELKDIEHAAKYVRGLDWVDPERIGILGGSYGGFAVLSAVTRLPEYWRAAVDLFGPSNLVTFVQTVPEHWKHFMREWVGDAEADRDFLIERSPITYVDQVRCPLLVIQGGMDPRVAKAESDQMVEHLESRGLEVEYIVFPDEGHGFAKRKNEFAAWRASAEFLLKHLGG